MLGSVKGMRANWAPNITTRHVVDPDWPHDFSDLACYDAARILSAAFGATVTLTMSVKVGTSA